MKYIFSICLSVILAIGVVSFASARSDQSTEFRSLPLSAIEHRQSDVDVNEVKQHPNDPGECQEIADRSSGVMGECQREAHSAVHPKAAVQPPAPRPPVDEPPVIPPELPNPPCPRPIESAAPSTDALIYCLDRSKLYN